MFLIFTTVNKYVDEERFLYTKTAAQGIFIFCAKILHI